MILSFFLFVLIILCLTFIVIPKRLSLLEILSIWMLVWILSYTSSSIIIVNLQYITVSNNISLFWALVFKRLCLSPLVITWSFDLILKHSSNLMITFHLLLTVIVLIAIDFLFIWLGILHNHNWNVIYSFTEWSCCVLLTYTFWIWYRKQLMKGT
ncbi:hypothetical protein [Heyndrickxia ginsengihumi]|uniref:Uncharacterized protein n=1 Tax=Heyndrickxia ginsengihumi TaxID=363870 RepID=A0A0A6XX90_9BACI|nr:hypothetical protein [Heyndrickxia ginsengihumi]KHD84732.1 hypothetical protein NG54_13545 [Heyndrickxia ginsengihumi]MBE6185395.1 hypothetical protein [Bacillus sp. (in: firmicutes)]MCM3023531.1 hypothetical protein [Heyndrickxia ginsengihumi]